MTWRRLKPGHHSARFGVHVFDVEREESGGREVWVCRLDWVRFDQADTLALAKHWCERTAANLREEAEA
jgi:hypothetical protein